METLVKIQSELKAPKDLFNKFGGYHYRSAESILEALKPLLKKYGASVVISDDIVAVGERVYVKATATISDGKETISVTAFAREPLSAKGQSDAQVTGATSSYARKYALNGLFLIDDNKDADTDEVVVQAQNAPSPAPKAKSKFTDKQMAQMKKWNDGTFTESELTDVKKRLGGDDFAKVIEETHAEYERRTAVF